MPISEIVTVGIQKVSGLFPKCRVFRKAPGNLAADTVEISGARFSPLKQELMEKARAYAEEFGAEELYIIDRNGEVLNLNATRNREYVDVHSINGIKFEIAKDFLINGTLIHSHPVPIPLSGGDICCMIENQLDEIIATTSSGFSSLRRKLNLSLKKDECLMAANIIGLKQKIKKDELGLDFYAKEIAHEKLEEYSQFSIKLLDDFANKFGFKFEHQGF